MPVVMTGVDPKHVLELAPAEDEQAVEALATHAADPTLGVGVRVRRLHGCADHSDSFALEDVIPEVHLVFADSRRFAEEWTYRFLATALTDAADPSPNG
jgi:hypothetical protein